MARKWFSFSQPHLPLDQCSSGFLRDLRSLRVGSASNLNIHNLSICICFQTLDENEQFLSFWCMNLLYLYIKIMVSACIKNDSLLVLLITSYIINPEPIF